MFYIVVFLISAFGWITSYMFLKPYLKRFTKKELYRLFSIFFILSIAGYFAVTYLNKEVDFFEDGIKQLKTVKYISDKVGDFQSYTYNPQLFKQNGNQAIFDVELHGKERVLFVTCLMEKRAENWILKEIKVIKLTSEAIE